MEKIRLTGLQSYEYEHLFDRRALNALKKTKGFDTIVKKFNKYGLERLFRIQYTGSNIKVTKNNYPELYLILKEACDVLFIKKIPELYLSWSYNVNAYTIGVENPIIAISSGCIDLLDSDELLFVIGHELGHIKSNHILYHQIASVLPLLGDLISSVTLGFGGLLNTAIELALLNCQRMSEFTADRAGLLACQSPESAVKAMMKIAGTPKNYFNNMKVDEFIRQAREFEGFDFNTLDKAAKYLSIMWREHPWTVMRGYEFFKWIDSGEYNRILNKYNNSWLKLISNVT